MYILWDGRKYILWERRLKFNDAAISKIEIADFDSKGTHGFLSPLDGVDKSYLSDDVNNSRVVVLLYHDGRW